MKDLRKLEDQIKDAKLRLQHACAQRWPEGSTLKFIRRHGQTKPSVGEVIGHDGEGQVRVTYQKIHRYRGAVTRFKRVHWTQIVN